MNTLDHRATYFRTSGTGCATLHGESWTEADLLGPDGRQSMNNAVFQRARDALLERLWERFPNYRPPTDRDSFGANVRKAVS